MKIKNRTTKCRNVSRELILLFDEGLLENVSGESKVHLGMCQKCQRELESFMESQVRRFLDGEALLHVVDLAEAAEDK